MSDTAPFDESLVINEKETTVGTNRAANRKAKLIAVQLRLRSARVVEEVPGIERIIPEKFVCRPMQAVGPLLENNRYLTAAVSSKPGFGAASVDAEFANGVDRRGQRKAVENRVHRIDPVVDVRVV